MCLLISKACFARLRHQSMDMRGSITFEWKMFRIPAHASLYSLVCGLIEMLVLGVLYGLTLTVH
jgi:hypothetical protein